MLNVSVKLVNRCNTVLSFGVSLSENVTTLIYVQLDTAITDLDKITITNMNSNKVCKTTNFSY